MGTLLLLTQVVALIHKLEPILHYGQSIVSWSGNSQANASIGHGLSSAPDLVITKSRTDANDWVTDVSNITGTTGDALRLNNHFKYYS